MLKLTPATQILLLTDQANLVTMMKPQDQNQDPKSLTLQNKPHSSQWTSLMMIAERNNQPSPSMEILLQDLKKKNFHQKIKKLTMIS
jgi:hypothetical protein